MTQQENMPEKIYATPRGSGTVSGVWVDMKMDDEPRGEYEYINAKSVEEMNRVLENLLTYAGLTHYWKNKIEKTLTAAKLKASCPSQKF